MIYVPLLYKHLELFLKKLCFQCFLMQNKSNRPLKGRIIGLEAFYQKLVDVQGNNQQIIHKK